MFNIRAVEQTDADAWATLMQNYFDFYKFEVTSEHLSYIFNQVLDSSSSLFSLVIAKENSLIGVANYIISPSTFTKYSCYLSDLYIKPDYRGNRLAEQLIAAVQSDASLRGCQSMHWLTATDNKAAQSVYDKIAHKASWLVYEKSW